MLIFLGWRKTFSRIVLWQVVTARRQPYLCGYAELGINFHRNRGYFPSRLPDSDGAESAGGIPH